MPTSLATLLLVLLIISNTLAKFMTPGCWGRNCLVQNEAGALCLQAAYNGAPTTCSDDVLSRLVDIHVHSKIGLSIVYYDERGSVLGSTIWPVPAPLLFAVYVCMSGSRSDANDRYRTLCRTALHDDDIHDAAAHIRECAIELPQRFVSDGCYTPSPESSAAANPLDKAALVHALFVLGGIVTVATLIAWFRKQLRDGWRYFVINSRGRRIFGVTRREELIPRPFDISLYPVPPGNDTPQRGNPRVDVRDRVTIAQPARVSYRPNEVTTRRTTQRGPQIPPDEDLH